MYIIAGVIWWLLFVFGCSVAVMGMVLVLNRTPNQAVYGSSNVKEDPTDLVETVKKFGTLVEDKCYEAKERYSYDEAELRLIINKISNKLPDEI